MFQALERSCLTWVSGAKHRPAPSSKRKVFSLRGKVPTVASQWVCAGETTGAPLQ